MRKKSVKKSARPAGETVHVYIRNERGRFIGGFLLPKENWDVLEKIAARIGETVDGVLALLLLHGAQKVIRKAVAA